MAGSKPPIPIVQEVRASPPSPTPRMGPLRNPPKIRASHERSPASNRQAIQWGRPVPVATVLSGLGNVDTSVSAQIRAKRLLHTDGVPVVGNYTDAIRSAAGFAFGPPRLPKQGFPAASYNYPSKAMVIGATLAGTPVVNPEPQGRPPKFVQRRRQGLPGFIDESPSEARRRMLSTLQGLGAQFPDTDKYRYADSPWFQSTNRSGCFVGPSDSGDANTWYATDCRVPPAVAATWGVYCDKTYGANAEATRLCKIVPGVSPNPPWSAAGRAQRGLDQDWVANVKTAMEAGTKSGVGTSTTPTATSTALPPDVSPHLPRAVSNIKNLVSGTTSEAGLDKILADVRANVPLRIGTRRFAFTAAQQQELIAFIESRREFVRKSSASGASSTGAMLLGVAAALTVAYVVTRK